MTALLEKAFSETKRLPEAEQNRVAEWLLLELEDEKRWDEQFANSMDILEQLVAEAQLESRQGRTKLLTPDQL